MQRSVAPSAAAWFIGGDAMTLEQDAQLALAHFAPAAGATLSRIDAGLINKTFAVRCGDGQQFVLQWVNPIFGPEVHDDIEAVTAHLESAGLTTPRLVRTTGGELCARDPSGGVWRLMTFIAGTTYERAKRPELCYAAAKLVGRFHEAVSSLRYAFKHRRLGVHDTPKHLAKLREALATHESHTAFRAVAPVGREILERAAALPPLTGLPARIVHGDLKLSNVMFSEGGEAVALVDLDTLAEMSLPIELGDAWRSWCNPRGEDDPEAAFEMAHFDAALRGYVETASSLLTGAEARILAAAVETIALELASRFCADALLESYFGWDPQRFASRSEHNLTRATSQLSLARSIARQRSDMERLVERLLLRSNR